MFYVGGVPSRVFHQSVEECKAAIREGLAEADTDWLASLLKRRDGRPERVYSTAGGSDVLVKVVTPLSLNVQVKPITILRIRRKFNHGNSEEQRARRKSLPRA